MQELVWVDPRAKGSAWCERAQKHSLLWSVAGRESALGTRVAFQGRPSVSDTSYKYSSAVGGR